MSIQFDFNHSRESKGRELLRILTYVLVLSLLLTAFVALSLNSYVYPVEAHPKTGAPSAQQFELPIKSVSPDPGAVGVRPDTRLVLLLDPEHPNWNRFRNHLEKGKLVLQLNGEPLETTYDPETYTLSAVPPVMDRYQEQVVTLLVKASLAQFRQSSPPTPGSGAEPKETVAVNKTESRNASYTWSFTTGSALHEPTHLTASVDTSSPRVTSQATMTLTFTDDYGLPAWGARINLGAVREGGTRLKNSLVISPALPRLLSEKDRGTLNLVFENHEAESVEVEIKVSGPYQDGRADHVVTRQFIFRPGLPARITLEAQQINSTVDTPIEVRGRVWDRHDNEATATVSVRAEGSAGWNRDFEIQTDTSGEFTVPIRPPDPQFVRVSGRVISSTDPDHAGVAAELGSSLTFERKVITGEATSTELLVTASETGAPAPFPITALAPRTVRGEKGSVTPGYQVTLSVDGQPAGSVQAEDDGSFLLEATRSFEPGDTLTITIRPFEVRKVLETVVIRGGPWANVLYNYDDQTSLTVWNSGYLPTGNYANIFRRSYLKFNLDSLPPDAEVKKATLTLYVGGYYRRSQTSAADRAASYYISEVTSPWNENLTWKNQPSVGRILDSQFVFNPEGQAKPYYWDVTPAVRDWVQNHTPNYGFQLKSRPPGLPESYNALWNFYGSEKTWYWPTMEVEYLSAQ